MCGCLKSILYSCCPLLSRAESDERLITGESDDELLINEPENNNLAASAAQPKRSNQEPTSSGNERRSRFTRPEGGRNNGNKRSSNGNGMSSSTTDTNRNPNGSEPRSNKSGSKSTSSDPNLTCKKGHGLETDENNNLKCQECSSTLFGVSGSSLNADLDRDRDRDQERVRDEDRELNDSSSEDSFDRDFFDEDYDQEHFEAELRLEAHLEAFDNNLIRAKKVSHAMLPDKFKEGNERYKAFVQSRSFVAPAEVDPGFRNLNGVVSGSFSLLGNDATVTGSAFSVSMPKNRRSTGKGSGTPTNGQQGLGPTVSYSSRSASRSSSRTPTCVPLPGSLVSSDINFQSDFEAIQRQVQSGSGDVSVRLSDDRDNQRMTRILETI